jgi:hypothetical protein
MHLDRIVKLLALTALAVCGGCGEPSRFGTLPDAAQGDGPEFTFLPAGLEVESAQPEGWTDVVVKLVPNLSVSGGSASAEDRESSSFRYVILADVKKPDRVGGDYILRRVGVGLSQPVKGRDTVVTMGTREQQGVALSKASRFALFALEDDMHQSTLLAGTPTFALVGTRARLKVGTSYRKVQLRYAIAVDPKTGALSRAVWPVDGQKPGPSLVELSGDPTLTVPMAVMLERSLGVVPKGVTYGMVELPKGRARPVPPTLAALCARERYSSGEAVELQKALGSVLQGQAGVDPSGPGPRTSALAGGLRN